MSITRRDARATLLLSLPVHEAAATRRLALSIVRLLIVVLHGRGCLLIKRQLLRAVLEEVGTGVGTLVGLKVDHVMRLLQVALVRTTLHLSSRIS